LKEFDTALSFSPEDPELTEKIQEFRKKTVFMITKKEALSNTQEALNLIGQDDFLSAGEKLKKALTAVFHIAKEQ